MEFECKILTGFKTSGILEFWYKFKISWLNCSVNKRNSEEGSYSCQCTMTLIETKETIETSAL